MSDRRRLACSREAVEPVFPVDKAAPLLDTNLCRRDGRYPEQFRNIAMRLGIATRANGSVYLECGRTKIVCCVHGPRTLAAHSAVRTYNTVGSICCHIEFAPFSGRDVRRTHQRDAEEQELEALILQAIEPTVRRERFPNGVVDIYMTVLENDGSVLGMAITAASVALAHARIDLYDSVVACPIMIGPSATLIVDPTAQEQNSALLTLAYLPNKNSISQSWLLGAVDSNVLQEAINMAIDGCRTVYESLAGKRIVPLLDRILVRKIRPMEKTPGGIYIPEKAQESLNRAEVLAVGPGSHENKVTLQPGDSVVLPNFGGYAVKSEKDKDEEVFLYRESEILAKIVDL